MPRCATSRRSPRRRNKSASHIRRTERQGYEGLLRNCLAHGNTEGLIQASREAQRRWPDDQGYLEKYLYVNLLAGREIELSLFRSAALLEKHPDDNPLKLATALGHMRLADMDQAIAKCQGIDLNFLTQGQQAVFAAIAKAGGFRKEAQQVLQAIPPDSSMLPEEKALMKTALSD